MDDPLSDKDALLADMAEHQRSTGQEVTAEANDRLAKPVFESLAAKVKAAKARKCGPIVIDPRARHVQAKANAAKRAKETGRAPWKIVEKPGGMVKDVAGFGPKTLAMYKALNARVEVLLRSRDPGPLGAPSWRDRVLAVLLDKMEAGPARRRSAALIALCEDSNASFGDWKKPLTGKLMFT